MKAVTRPPFNLPELRYNLCMSTIQNPVLLHSCCGPCTLMPHELLAADGWDITLYYCNHNIDTEEEYEKRLTALKTYAEATDTPLILAEYTPGRWEEEVGIHGGPYPLIPEAEDYDEMVLSRMRRCGACYKLRFTSLAELAKRTGYTAITSTLSVSPYQFTGLISDTLRASAHEQDITALERDWTPYYREATAKSRALGMYRQNYCGCRYSKIEAEQEKLARKLQRKSTQHHHEN